MAKICPNTQIFSCFGWLACSSNCINRQPLSCSFILSTLAFFIWHSHQEFDDLPLSVMIPTVDGPAKSCTAWKMVYPIIYSWLVGLTILKHISQWERLSHILWKIKNVWNHQPDRVSTILLVQDFASIHNYFRSCAACAKGAGFVHPSRECNRCIQWARCCPAWVDGWHQLRAANFAGSRRQKTCN